jgi:CspA family cold shock protein
MKKALDHVPGEAARRRSVRIRNRLTDNELEALRNELEELAALAPDDLLSRIDIRCAGSNFARLLGCNRDKDFHTYSDIMMRAETLAADYAAIDFGFDDQRNQYSNDGRINTGFESILEGRGLEVLEISGFIKWFDISKGYGFIVPDNGLPDVLLHVTCLRAGGYQTAIEGARVECQVLARPKGMQAFRILHMDESTAIHPSLLPSRTHVIVEPQSDWQRATVKWFNRVRGFGFLSLGSGVPDVFVHMETLRRFGFSDLRVGQIVQVRWGHGAKGCMAAELRPDAQEL